MNEAPSISVFLPTYQSEKYLKQTLSSILAQSFLDFEIYVYDDASNDETRNILRSASRADSRIKVVENPVNQGVGKSYLQFLKAAQGRYLAQIGHDDVWETNFLEESFKALENQPEAVVSFSKVQLIDSNGQANSRLMNPFQHELLDQDHFNLFLRLLEGNFLCAASSFMRREATVGWQNRVQTDYLQDWASWLWMVTQGKFLSLQTTQVLYRVHGENLSLSRFRSMQGWQEHRLCLSQLLAESGLVQFIESFRHEDSLNRFLLAFLKQGRRYHFDFGRELLVWFKSRYEGLSAFTEFSAWTHLIQLAGGMLNEPNRSRDPEALTRLIQKHGFSLKPGFFLNFGLPLESRSGALVDQKLIRNLKWGAIIRVPDLGIFTGVFPRTYCYFNPSVCDILLLIERVAVAYQSSRFVNLNGSKIRKKLLG